MPKLLVASHGTFASGIKSSLKILLGKSDNVTVFDAYLDESNFKDKLDGYFQSVEDEEQVIMLSDLYGGSVNQEMSLYLTRPNTYLIAGMNLALVLELALKTEPQSLEMLAQVIEESRQALRLVDLESDISDEEDFF